MAVDVVFVFLCRLEQLLAEESDMAGGAQAGDWQEGGGWSVGQPAGRHTPLTGQWQANTSASWCKSNQYSSSDRK